MFLWLIVFALIALKLFISMIYCLHCVLIIPPSLPWLESSWKHICLRSTSMQQEMMATANLLEQMSNFTCKIRHSLQLNTCCCKTRSQGTEGIEVGDQGKEREIKSGSDEWGRGNQRGWMTVSIDEKRKRVRYVLQACAWTAVAVLALLAAFHVVVLL